MNAVALAILAVYFLMLADSAAPRRSWDSVAPTAAFLISSGLCAVGSMVEMIWP